MNIQLKPSTWKGRCARSVSGYAEKRSQADMWINPYPKVRSSILRGTAFDAYPTLPTEQPYGAKVVVNQEFAVDAPTVRRISMKKATVLSCIVGRTGRVLNEEDSLWLPAMLHYDISLTIVEFPNETFIVPKSYLRLDIK